MPSTRTFAAIVCLAALLSSAAMALCCDAPVYQYALENWKFFVSGIVVIILILGVGYLWRRHTPQLPRAVRSDAATPRWHR